MNDPHRRYDPLTNRWILVSPQRTDRPWQGSKESASPDDQPAYDPACYLCPGNVRANGEQNPDYDGTWWFPNDFAALLPEPSGSPIGAPPSRLLRAAPVLGTCRVLCFSPQHNLTLARMSIAGVRSVVDLWAGQIAELSRRWVWVQVFENRGEAMGASNPHPHGQLWATSVLPRRITTEDEQQRRWHADLGRPLLQATLDEELADGSRIVLQTEHFVVLVPFWATWPFETLVLPRRHVRRLPELDDAERNDLATALHRLTARYDNLFLHPFPYSMGWHGAPGSDNQQGGAANHWQLHAHFYPPLLRSASVRKFMVGFELLAEEQRDLTAETAAQRLAELSDVHYLDDVDAVA